MASDNSSARRPLRTDGNFAVPLPREALEFTGERMTAGIEGQIEFEHYHRYCFARDFCCDLDVLDVASGEGYGSALLAGVARSVTGVELDPSSVQHATENYGRPNLRYLNGDAQAMPVGDASVDVVVSFETLEHLPDQARFLAEIRRVLRPGGLLMISTPDRTVYSAPGADPNPFHVLELTPPEFQALLQDRFSHVSMLVQRPVLGSVLAAENRPGWRSYERRSLDRIEATPGLARGHYLVALASDSPLPDFGSSAYLDRRRVHDIVQDAMTLPRLDARLAEALSAGERLEWEITSERRRTESERQHRVEQLKQHRAALEALREQVASRDAALAEAIAARDMVANSGIWRLTAPLRRLGSEHPRVARNLRRVLQVIWWTATLQIGHRFLLWRRHRAAAAQQATAEVPSLPEPAAPAAAPPRTPLTLRLDFEEMYGTAPIGFPAVDEPEVSVIIPAYRGLPELLNCLRSLAVHRRGEPPFELILVDDCPAEPVLALIPESPGLVGIANAENLGFLRTCNRGAEAARGRILCLLNSDTIVQAGWLRTLVEALDSSPRAALVGSMLLNDDGSIQDAGWRILSNGWGQPIGRDGDPRNGAYTRRRRVDCVTGACFAVPRRVWDALGGLDTAYAPAFYEEFDFAFRAKEKGLEVIYEPRSRVVHLGSSSYGAERRDQLSGINQQTFAARFAETLRRQPGDPSDEFAIAEAGHPRPVILVVDHGVPRPDRHAGDVTMTSYLQLLVQAGWRVVFGPRDGLAEGPAAEALETLGIELIRAPWTIEGWLAEHGKHLDAAWISRPEIAAKLLGPLRAHSRAEIAYYTHDLHFQRMEREAATLGDAALTRAAAEMREKELAVLRAADRVMTPSGEEAEVIRGLLPEQRVIAIPSYCYTEEELHPRDAPHFEPLQDVLFVGGFPHTPNVDAALFIAREVMPLVWRERPEARLLLVGYAPPAEVRALAGPRIVVTGQVPELDPYFDRSRVMLAALRYGAGVKGKVVEALRFGLPVVTTPVGAEGIGIAPGVEALVAEDAAGLAAGVLALLGDAERCSSLSQAGVALMRRRFTRSAARAALNKVFHTPRCSACGSAKLVAPPLDGNFRESFVCLGCYALGRAEAMARVLVRRFARAGESSLPELMRSRPELRIHELGFVGGIADALNGFPNYSTSEFFPDVPLGTPGPRGVRCEDVTRLTYADASFDMVLSQDVMEHVPDPVRGFAETARVLRPGGSHFFTIPQYPDMPRSVTRARLGAQGVEHLLPAEYHGDPVRSEGALVFTDYGADLPELIARAGLLLVEHDIPVLGGTARESIRIFEAVKLPPLPDLSREDAMALADLQDSQEAYEVLIRRLYTSELQTGDTAIDGGANFGAHTGPLTTLVGPTGRVHAFEPLPHAADYVRKALEGRPQLTLHNKALGQEAGRATFHHVVNDAALSSLLDRDLSFAYPDLDVQKIETELVPLDTLADEPVRFIKLDLEGYDFLALRGAAQLLRRQRPVIAFEFGGKDAALPAGYDAPEFFAFFEGVDYRLLDLAGRPFTTEFFNLPWDQREVPHYVVAVPKEREDVAPKLRAQAWSILVGAGRRPAGA